MSDSHDRLRELPDRDLRFIVSAVTTRRSDIDRIVELIRGKPDLIELMVVDDRVFERIVNDEEILLKISPYLLFTVLLRRAQKDLQQTSFTMEVVGAEGRVPIFDASDAARLLEDKTVLNYLAEMLTTFTRTDCTTLHFREGSSVRRRTFSDMDVDDILALAGFVEEDYRFPFFKRVGDVCLFLTGLFPEHVAVADRRNPMADATVRIFGRKRRVLADYEKLGQDFYRRAAEMDTAQIHGLRRVLETIADSFTLARKPLHVLAERYIPVRRLHWFPAGTGATADSGG